MAETERRAGEVWIEYVPLHEISRWPRNPKDHDFERLDRSFARFGFVNPLLYDETTGKLVAGHGRLEQLEARQDAGEQPPSRIRVDDDGVWYVPVQRGVAFANEREAEAYLLADNRIGEGLWKDDELGPILRDHYAADEDFDALGFDEDDEYVKRLLAEVDEPTDANEGEVGDDDPPAPPSDRLPPIRSPRDAQWRVVHADCRDALPKIDSDSIDSCVTDPPYGYNFMNRAWDRDGIAFSVDVWREVLRVMKPGAHLVAFAADKTIHRVMCAIEDAGFELRHMGAWITAQVFPKSWDVSKAIDAALGAEREVVGEQPAPGELLQAATQGGTGRAQWSGVVLGGAATWQAAEWAGWGTAIKTLEPFVLARKPLSESGVAQNVMKHRTGGLNIDGCRLPWDGPGDMYAPADGSARTPHPSLNLGGGSMSSGQANPAHAGRWPSAVIVSDLDVDGPIAGVTVDGEGGEGPGVLGSASRFFRIPGGDDEGLLQLPPAMLDAIAPTVLLVPKAGTAEREMGLAHMPEGEWNDGRQTPADHPRLRGRTGRRNTHVSVKPVALLRHLARLVTPPGGIVLDPFTGSGSTGVAAVWEGFDFHGIEKSDTDDEPYVRIARARVTYAMGREAPPLRVRQQEEPTDDDEQAADP